MKIKIKDKPYSEVKNITPPIHKKPEKQTVFFRWLLKVLSASDLKAVNFSYRKTGMDKMEKGTPCLILMNHSSFIDLKIASTLLGDSQFHIICTSDGFVGKEWLMRKLGCIPTRKFQSDAALVKDMVYTLRKLKSSILMYPEASYTFDGTATPLPQSLGKCIKLLGVPVVMIRTYGAFARDPLYNNLKLRKVNVSADMEYILSPEDIKNSSPTEINDLLTEKFTFDSFRWQQENKIVIDEPFRADSLNRVLYKCPDCGEEGIMYGKGDTISCKACGKSYILTELGYLRAADGVTRFNHIPDWYAWQREEVRKELIDGSYKLEVPVTIGVMVDMRCIYRVGKGVLTHDNEGFRLVGCDGEIDFRQLPSASYSLYSDFYWYEIGDIICIGTGTALYYCFLEDGKDVAAKTRIAAEELYKLAAERRIKSKV